MKPVSASVLETAQADSPSSLEEVPRFVQNQKVVSPWVRYAWRRGIAYARAGFPVNEGGW